ncbi:MAG: hypothetical protein WB987_04850 [Candidatus Acidiferrales bacterium]
MKNAASVSREGTKVFLAVPLRAVTANYGSEYARLSLQTPTVVEIGIDDFTGQYVKLFASGRGNPEEILNSLIDGVKSHGSRLEFGATLYEDELQLSELDDPKLPSAIRAKFDIVHLYLHYRANGLKTPDYLEQAKKLFPNAKILLGVYAYDRISYMPCEKGNPRPCSKQEERDYLAKTLDVDIALLKTETAAGLEFYPGSFGREEEWSGWDKPRICPGRKQDCIDNTKALRRVVADEFRKQM